MKQTRAGLTRLKIRLILYKDEQRVYAWTKWKKTRMLQSLQGVPVAEWDSAYVRVTYNDKLDYYNHAWFSTFKEAERLIKEMTAWEEVKGFL